MNNPNLLDEIIIENTALVRRRKLLPWWMIVFVWIFMITGVLALPAFIIGITGYNFRLSLYGLDTTEPLSLMGIFLELIFILKGIASYGLWAEKDWGINVALADAISGIVICIVVMILPFVTEITGIPFSFRLELFILAPYLMKLKQIKPEWVKDQPTFI